MNVEGALNIIATPNFLQTWALKSFTHFCQHRAPMFIMVTVQ